MTGKQLMLARHDDAVISHGVILGPVINYYNRLSVDETPPSAWPHHSILSDHYHLFLAQMTQMTYMEGSDDWMQIFYSGGSKTLS